MLKVRQSSRERERDEEREGERGENKARRRLRIYNSGEEGKEERTVEERERE